MENFNLTVIDTQIATASEIELRKDDNFFNHLSAQLNKMINENFEQLIALLYRVDVSENKLKNILASNKAALSGNVLAKLIIERQLEKIETRKKFKTNPKENNEEEIW